MDHLQRNGELISGRRNQHDDCANKNGIAADADSHLVRCSLRPVATLRGSCLCGGVKFELTEAPDRLRYCHCESCKKLSGGGGTVNVRMRSAAVHILEGKDLIRTYQPPEGSAKTFCLACGSNLFGGGWPEAEYCSVRVTTLEEPVGPLPGAHIYVRSLATWEQLPDDGFERFETTAG